MAKIKVYNEASYNMFQKLGFKTVKVAKAFNEYEMRFNCTLFFDRVVTQWHRLQ